jgi:hypothetical protein
MELVEIIALAHFEDSRIGGVSKKMRLKVPSVVADDLESIGLVQILNPRVATAQRSPVTVPQVVGQGVSPVLLQADRVSPRKIASSLETKDGRPLLSMTATVDRHLQIASTLAMSNGGMSTTSESEQITEASVGRKMRGRPKGSKSTASVLKTKQDSELMT